MKYISVCSGICAATVAWKPLGWTPVAFSEIEPFPCSVLKHHHPEVPNLGDMTKFEEWDFEPGSIDALVGGTPCQSFSIAGLRGGLEDGRGNLALTYCRILQKFKPRWFIWENVPGVLSSWSGDTPSSMGISPGPGRTMDLEETSDFASIIGAFSELGYGVSGRILDAQYFGVPQRRRRVFVVGYLGDWRRAAEALFEFGCVSGNLATGSKKRKDVAGTLASRATAGGGLGTDFDLDGGLHVAHPVTTMSGGQHLEQTLISSPLTTRPYADQLSDESKLIAYQCQGTNVGPMGTFRAGNGNETGGVPFIATSSGDKAHCLNAGGMGRQDYETETMVVAFDTTQITSKQNVSNPKYGDACHPIPAHGHAPAIAVSSFRTAGDGAAYDSGDKTAALTTATDPNANIIAFSGRDRGDDGRGYGREPNVTGDITETVDATKPPRVAGPSIGVRRLTPVECERLQGFPNDYTNVMHRGKPAADGNRYKSLGNSMAVVVMAFLGKRIDIVDAQIKAESIKST